MSHFVINLKWMVGGLVNPVISVIIDDNNYKKCYENQNILKNPYNLNKLRI